MNTQQAVAFVLEMHDITKYRLAQQMSAAPVSVNQWLKGTKMSPANIKLFNDLYNVEIKD